MRWLLVLLAGCAFRAHQAPGDAASEPGLDGPSPGSDALAVQDAPADAPRDAPPDAAPVPITFVEEVSGQTTGDAASVQLSPQTAGDLDVLAASWSGTTVTIQSVTDTDRNTWTQVDTAVQLSGSGTLAIWIAPSVKQGSSNNVITVQFSATTNPILIAATYRGLAASPLDVRSNASSATGAALDSGAATTTAAHELLLGIGAASRSLGPGTSYTPRTTGLVDIFEDREVTATGAYHATAAASQGTGWIMRLVALKAR